MCQIWVACFAKKPWKPSNQLGVAKGTDDEAYSIGSEDGLLRGGLAAVQEAESFQLPIKDWHLEGLDPDRDLIA